MHDLALDSPLLLCVLVAVFGALSSLMPMSPAEPVLVGVAMLAPEWLLPPLVVLATLSHMSSKTLVFLGGTKIERAFNARTRERLERARQRLTGRSRLQQSTLFISSVTSVPPFYLTTALCGTLQMPLRHFLLLATTGRAIRYTALIFLPQLFRASPVGAQPPQPPLPPPAITDAGQGTSTYVLISGMMGGVAGYRQLEQRLLAQGNRVIVIDPYQLSIDSADVSFEAMARRVDVALEQRGVTTAHVVGHAHGGGVALRLAARPNSRVNSIFLIDVGAQAGNRSAVFNSSLRLVPFITKLPYGRDFVRDCIIDGVRENSARTEWLDAAAQRAYADPILDHIHSVIALAYRLAEADEPEPVSVVLQRIRVPITVVLGAQKSPAGPAAAEMTALLPLGKRVTTTVLPGVAHFPHEESPDEVAQVLLRPRLLAAAIRQE